MIAGGKHQTNLEQISYFFSCSYGFLFHQSETSFASFSFHYSYVFVWQPVHCQTPSSSVDFPYSSWKSFGFHLVATEGIVQVMTFAGQRNLLLVSYLWLEVCGLCSERSV